ncbi:MAG: hypothetical protein AB1668_02425 [Nanoarchaeota archaeon]
MVLGKRIFSEKNLKEAVRKKKNVGKKRKVPSKKKGIAIGQVFVYITAAITFALIMIFGYRAVQDFLQSGEKVAFVQFKTGLESSIKKIYTEYGSVRVERFTLPAEFSQICFVDMDAEYDEALCRYDQVACTVWKDAGSPNEEGEIGGYNSVDENIFLKPAAPVKIKSYRVSIGTPPSTLLPGTSPNSKKGEEGWGAGFLCLPIKKGVFSVVMEGKGDRTELSPAEGPAES